MRCSGRHTRRKFPWLLWGLLLLSIIATAAFFFSYYVNHSVKPTLHELAEYEARSATAQAINRAISGELQAHPVLYQDLCIQQENTFIVNASAAKQAESALVSAVQDAMDALPQTEYYIPFGSLTDNSLLSGLGPGWPMQLQPQGYTEGTLQETTESLAINTVRYSLVLILRVTINMILDGRTATISVENSFPLLTVLLQGDTPIVHAQGVN